MSGGKGRHITVGSLVGGIIALIVGGGLAAATVVGIVSSQTSSGETPIKGTVQSQVMDYGTNQ